MRQKIADTVSAEDRRKLIKAARAGASNLTSSELIGISRSGYATLLAHISHINSEGRTVISNMCT